MGAIHEPTPVLLLVAAFSRHESAFDWGRAMCESHWGPIALESERFEFTETDYYEPSMGGQLKKQFWAFEQRVDPAILPECKLATNAWEQELADTGDYEEQRPLNLDPGYLSLSKLVLASTKDHAHRIYLSQGIYAEITLTYRGGGWQSHDLTFADYQRDDYQAFFDECRSFLRVSR
ncbi:MAG: DUF4416 family protein [Pirellulales bacterium]|nr:DUF4416 family protein [Pirellulales bacterium]